MVAREQFESELALMKQKVIHLAEGAKQQLQDSVSALYQADTKFAGEVIEADKKLDKMDLDINETAILLIAKQQPVASDLRKLIVAIRLSTDLERMADNAKNIARSTTHLGDNHGMEIPKSLGDMRDVALRMIDLAILAYKQEDISLARELSELDDQIDTMYSNGLQSLLEETVTNPQKIQFIMQIAFCGRFIERFGDHLTNIAESIMYLVKGESLNLNE
ncbi:phosphate transport system regulatory protein PhoU [Paraliobacillus quinghaiensis]|uniref:Phosphate-specific transport system accessory protein PhoU n=1 Tax=Paraliobacillus quinghaiensis TaxID=470815 RepID=A0A917TPP7_9BACI|nr:phosphate signaling complex protein PhoU [Paraliobacillus quinghaiensis]GGM31510.1 phosphate transport system regulatory protein PhoU [Paraliobacillus quinghaiensis]